MSKTDTVQKNYQSINLIKVIATYFVVLYHNFYANSNVLTPNNSVGYFTYFLKTILGCCVPLFFFVNGALLLNKRLDIKRHIKKVISLVLLTLIWGAITLVSLMYIRNEFFSIKDSFFGILTLKQGWINSLWFLTTMVMIYTFFPIMKSAFDNNRNYFRFFFVVVCILTFGNVFISMCVNVVEFMLHKNNFTGNFNFFYRFNAFSGIYGYSLGYFMLGGYFHYNISLQRERKNRKNN